MPTLDGPVLHVLAGTTEPMTGRRIHRLVGTASEAGVRKVLARLVDHGLVTVSEVGPSLVYLGNRRHLAWSSVESLVAVRSELLARLRLEIGSWQVPAMAAALFGSAARGDGDTRSDIDLLLVRGTPDGEAWREQVDLLREHVLGWTGNFCQVYEVDEDGLAAHLASDEPIVAEWRRDAVRLAGHDLRRLVGRSGPERS